MRVHNGGPIVSLVNAETMVCAIPAHMVQVFVPAILAGPETSAIDVEIGGRAKIVTCVKQVMPIRQNVIDVLVDIQVTNAIFVQMDGDHGKITRICFQKSYLETIIDTCATNANRITMVIGANHVRSETMSHR